MVSNNMKYKSTLSKNITKLTNHSKGVRDIVGNWHFKIEQLR